MFTARFRWLSALPLLVVIGALAVIALGALSGAQSPNARGREMLFDYYQRLKPASLDGAPSFHLVLIDRDSLDRIGPWPWPRTILADLAEAAHGAGAKGVVLAEPVDSPDPLSPKVIGDFWLGGARDDELARQLALLPSTDAALAAALTGGDSAIAAANAPPDDPFSENALQRVDLHGIDWLNLGAGQSDFVALPAGVMRYAVDEALLESAQLTVSALAPDPDGVVRRLPLLWALDGRPAPALALAAARLAATDGAAAPVILDADPSSVSARGQLISGLSLDGRKLAVSRTGVIRLYAPKSVNLPSTPAWRILSGAGSNRQLEDAVVIVGTDASLGENVRTARGPLPAAAVHALAAEQILAGATLNRPGWAGYAEAIAVMLLGAAAIMAAQRLDFWQALGVAALISVLLLVISFAAFSTQSLLLNPLPPALALLIGAFSVAGGKSLGVALRDDSVRGSFHDSLPESAMKQLREDGRGEILDGVMRQITVLACELRLTDDDLDRLSATPDDVSKIMASASLNLRRIIIDTGGAVDQAEGGRLFAYYNAPLEAADHIEAACSAALRLVESMDKINAELESSSHTRGVQVHLAIGIATGECFTGPMGHGRHNRYSAIGPAVDMASFLRRQSEYYGPAMICDETVYRQSHHHFAFLELDRLRTNRSERLTGIYALIGNPFIKSSKSYRALDETHRQMLAAYRSGDLTKAKAMLEKSKSSPGAKIALFDIYEERIRKLSEEGVPEGWDGSHPATI